MVCEDGPEFVTRETMRLLDYDAAGIVNGLANLMTNAAGYEPARC